MNIKLLSSTALAMALVLASTGCRHKPYNVTPLPGENPPPVSTLPPGPTFPPGPPIGTEQPIAETGGGWDPSNYNQNRDALAADSIHFAFDSAVIRDSDQANLQAIAQQLQANPNDKLMIEGNCDERGTEEYNRALGERRALAAREALAALGVSPDRIRTISYGKDKPVDPGHDEDAWSKNRRDDFVLLEPKMGT